MRDPMRWAFTVFRVYGIPIRIHLLFVIVTLGLFLRQISGKHNPMWWVDALGLIVMLINRLSGLVLPASSKYLIDDVLTKGRTELLWPIALVTGAATLVQAVTSYALSQVLGIAAQADRSASILAYGDVKRLELAMAIASDPLLLLMDEPAAGMAPAERIDLMELTVNLVKERNLAVLFTEHSMDVVFSYAHHILVLSRGKIIASGTPPEVRDNREVQEVYLGSAAFLDVSKPVFT